MRDLTPRQRHAIYTTVIVLAALYVVAYLVLAVISPLHAQRLISAPQALLTLAPAVVAAGVAVLARVHVPAVDNPPTLDEVDDGEAALPRRALPADGGATLVPESRQ